MKKLVFIMGIVALSTLMSASMASAQGIAGTWEMISSGICLHSVNGWEEAEFAIDGYNGWKPVKPAKVWAGTATATGAWTFIGTGTSGTGTAVITNYASIFPGAEVPAPYVGKNPYVGVSVLPIGFNWEITGNVIKITGTSGSATGLEMEGKISMDFKTMTLFSGDQVQDFSNYGLGYLIMNNMRILIKVNGPS